MKLLAQHDIHATNKPNHQKRRGDKENSPHPSANSENAWQESSSKAMLRRRLGIGPELDRETQNTLSRTIRAMITHTCGVTLKETYTKYQNEGMWDDAVKIMLILHYSIMSANILLEVLAHPMAVKAEWSWPLFLQ